MASQASTMSQSVRSSATRSEEASTGPSLAGRKRRARSSSFAAAPSGTLSSPALAFCGTCSLSLSMAGRWPRSVSFATAFLLRVPVKALASPPDVSRGCEPGTPSADLAEVREYAASAAPSPSVTVKMSRSVSLVASVAMATICLEVCCRIPTLGVQSDSCSLYSRLYAPNVSSVLRCVVRRCHVARMRCPHTRSTAGAAHPHDPGQARVITHAHGTGRLTVDIYSSAQRHSRHTHSVMQSTHHTLTHTAPHTALEALTCRARPANSEIEYAVAVLAHSAGVKTRHWFVILFESGVLHALFNQSDNPWTKPVCWSKASGTGSNSCRASASLSCSNSGDTCTSTVESSRCISAAASRPLMERAALAAACQVGPTSSAVISAAAWSSATRSKDA
mmetsp:Transcript_73406/g.163001  ORF Transcript_73406/g.163001 Transcript_73406/m.163001 type:complete len:392 (-) Transcript_73406:4560-5735(-)